VSWKSNLQLLDLSRNDRLEVSCKTCSYHWYVYANQEFLIRMRHLFIDEYEALEKCRQRACCGSVRVALAYEADTEGFQGGLA